jgi:hypothetical protein
VNGLEDTRLSTSLVILVKRAILYAAVFIAVIAYGGSLIISLSGDFPNPATALVGIALIALSVTWCFLLFHLSRTKQFPQKNTLRDNWASSSKSGKAFMATTLAGFVLGVVFFIVGGSSL